MSASGTQGGIVKQTTRLRAVFLNGRPVIGSIYFSTASFTACTSVDRADRHLFTTA